jgi:hypothetical protein
MISYCCLMLDPVGTIRSIRTMICADDFAAEETAQGVLVRSPQYEGVEVWRRGERAGKVLHRTELGVIMRLDARRPAASGAEVAFDKRLVEAIT